MGKETGWIGFYNTLGKKYNPMNKPEAIQGSVSFVELPYQKDKRKYWCKVVITELKNQHPLPVAVHRANQFLEEYEKTFSHG